MNDTETAFDFERRDAPDGADDPAQQEGLLPIEERVMEALRTVFDPEIPVNIVELGLIYDLRISADGAAEIDMTLTAPNCPVAGEMPAQVENAAAMVEGITAVKARLVWTPPWTQERMSEAAKLELGMF